MRRKEESIEESENTYSHQIKITQEKHESHDDEENEQAKVEVGWRNWKERLARVLFWCALAIFFIGIATTVACVQVASLGNQSLGGIMLWQWSLLITAVIGGAVTNHALRQLILVIINLTKDRNLVAIDFVMNLLPNTWAVFYFSILLIAWTWVVHTPSFFHNSQQNKGGSKQDYFHFLLQKKYANIIRLTLIAILLGAFFFLIKDWLIASHRRNFHIMRFKERIIDSLTEEYWIKLLTQRPPIIEDITFKFRGMENVCGSTTEIPWSSSDLEHKLHNLSDFEMRIVVHDIIEGRPIKYINERNEPWVEIHGEREAKKAAGIIFSKLIEAAGAQHHSSYPHIDDEVLQKALDNLLPKHAHKVNIWLRGGVHSPTIRKKTIRKCLIRAVKKRQTLRGVLQSNKKIFQQLDRMVNVALVVVIFVVWLVLLQDKFRKAMPVIGGFLVGSGFITGEFLKNLLSSISFVFLAHPFDVGDCCLIEGTPVTIEAIELLQTVAVTLDDERRYYPNSSLAKLSMISNYTRSPDDMGDSVTFYLDARAKEDQIKELKSKVKSYIRENCQLWQREHQLVLELDEQEKRNILKATLHFKHTINYHYFREREERKNGLILELTKFLEDSKLMRAAPHG